MAVGLQVGVLALQGSFKEHIAALRKLGVDAVEVRKPEQLLGLAGLIIPGGESTTMAKLAEEYKLLPALREFGTSGKPIWGTCAGLIFLADRAHGQKTGGQALLGGLNCTVHRNFFGSQLNSFETELPAPTVIAESGGSCTFRAVFIRAPAILEAGPEVEILAEYTVPPTSPQAAIKYSGLNGEQDKVIVAVKQRNLLATAFHPELTSDTRWHQLFMNMICEGERLQGLQKGVPTGIDLHPPLAPVKDLPVFRDRDYLCFD